MKLLKRLDDQIVHRKPDGPSPVRVAAEQARTRFGGFVVDPMLRAIDLSE